MVLVLLPKLIKHGCCPLCKLEKSLLVREASFSRGTSTFTYRRMTILPHSFMCALCSAKKVSITFESNDIGSSSSALLFCLVRRAVDKLISPKLLLLYSTQCVQSIPGNAIKPCCSCESIKVVSTTTGLRLTLLLCQQPNLSNQVKSSLESELCPKGMTVCFNVMLLPELSSPDPLVSSSSSQLEQPPLFESQPGRFCQLFGLVGRE